MKSVVITGSTRGIGYGLADAFLALGCRVVISGRTEEAVSRATESLAGRYEPDRLLGLACDVTVLGQVQALWDATHARFDSVDIWINNAGIGHEQLAFWDLDPAAAAVVVQTNLVGALNGAHVAMNGMLSQGQGAIYNMEGHGSNGRLQFGLSVYGTSKAGMRYFTDALADESRNTPVLVGGLRPGMVVTDMLTEPFRDRPEDWARARRIFNIIADRVETVAPWLARRVLQNRQHGVHIQWLTRPKLVRRFVTAPFHKRELFEDE
jgi:NAD(P)-dependent dehydrogenase (short-subunit alcohol dehydrogenase family)